MSEPREFGQYQLLEKIAQGGMAEIFRGKAIDPQGIEKPVVIKRILPQIAASPEFVEMLIDEAKIAVLLSHGNIAKIYDLGKVADDYFIVMEYVHGKTVSQIMKRLRTLNKRMPVPYAIWIASEIASGLDYMHRKTDEQGVPLNIVHRDISPQNIILSTSGTVKIIDFGIAKAKTKVSTTDSGVLKGKFAYMSPEHAEGERLDHRTDIFSLGVILHELLTGQRLFKGENNRETIQKVRKGKIPAPSSVRTQVTRELDRIVLTALQRDHHKRFQTAEEFGQELTRYFFAHYPQFAPRELITYLIELFPDVGGAEKNQPVPTETERGKAEPVPERPEVTAAASRKMIQKRLDEQEIYTAESRPDLEKEEEKTSRIKLRLFLKPILIGGLALLILFTGWRLGPIAEKTARQTIIQAKSFWSSLRITPREIPESIRETPPLPEPSPTPAPPPPGQISISSTPAGATIFLDDQKTEVVTPTLLNVPPGRSHRVGLYLEKHRFWEGEVQIDAGKTITLSVPLEINYGDLEINSLPEGATVTLNGQKVGETPYLATRIPPETTYRVSLEKNGYEAWDREIKVFGGKRESLNISLKKIPKSKSLR